VIGFSAYFNEHQVLRQAANGNGGLARKGSDTDYRIMYNGDYYTLKREFVKATVKNKAEDHGFPM